MDGSGTRITAVEVAASFEAAGGATTPVQAQNRFVTFQVSDTRILGTQGGFLQLARVYPVEMSDDGEAKLGDPMIVKYPYGPKQAPMKFGCVYSGKVTDAAVGEVTDIRPSTTPMMPMPDCRDGKLVAEVAKISPPNRVQIFMPPSNHRRSCLC